MALTPVTQSDIQTGKRRILPTHPTRTERSHAQERSQVPKISQHEKCVEILDCFRVIYAAEAAEAEKEAKAKADAISAVNKFQYDEDMCVAIKLQDVENSKQSYKDSLYAFDLQLVENSRLARELQSS